MIPNETTPAVITPAIVLLGEKLGAGLPLYVPVRPSPHALVQKCYLNVDAHVRANGGEAVEGWLIWEEEQRRWLAAIHHCVWRTPTGGLVDITPLADREAQIVFCPGGRKWDREHPVAPVYEPEVADATVHRFCDTWNEIHRWTQENTRSGQAVVPDSRIQRLYVAQVELLAELAGGTVAGPAPGLTARPTGVPRPPALGDPRPDRPQHPTGTRRDARGMTDEAKRRRRDMLAAQAEEQATLFRRSGDPDAVGFSIDVSGGKGRVMGKFVIAAEESIGLPEAEVRIRRLVDANRRRGRAATVNVVVPFAAAKELVAPFDPGSVRKLEGLQRARLANARIVVAVGMHGKSYGYLSVDGPGFHDAARRIVPNWPARLGELGWRAGIWEGEDAHGKPRHDWNKKAQERAHKKAQRKRKNK